MSIKHSTSLLYHSRTSKGSISRYSMRMDASINDPQILSLNDMNQLISRVDQVNNGVNIIESNNPMFRKFYSSGKLIGFVDSNTAQMLTANYSNIFRDHHDDRDNLIQMHFIDDIEQSHDPYRKKTEAIAYISSELRDKHIIRSNQWRNELLPVTSAYSHSSQPDFLIERAVYPLFGLQGYGVHINGYKRDRSLSQAVTHMWVAKRSKNKSTYPRMFDHIVAGGLPHGISPIENCIKECKLFE